MTGADESRKETAIKEGVLIPASKKPKNGGWHWPTYWQVKAVEAKEIPNDGGKQR